MPFITGLGLLQVGDPTGKDTSRKMLSEADIAANIAGMQCSARNTKHMPLHHRKLEPTLLYMQLSYLSRTIISMFEDCFTHMILCLIFRRRDSNGF